MVANANSDGGRAKTPSPAWFLLLCILLAWAATLAQAADLAHINRALRAHLALAKADSAYIVVDRQAKEVRLQHGKAVLRACPIVSDAFGPQTEVAAQLERRLRRSRPSGPWAKVQTGAFDWEHNLVQAANENCALYFDNGLLIYATEAWGAPRAPAVRIGIKDLKALYNTASGPMPLVILPPNWKRKAEDVVP